MAWKKSITGIALCIQLLEQDSAFDLDTRHNPEAGENILALAQLAVHKVFCRLGVWQERREYHREDALQEAALAITTYAHRGPRPAYVLAKKRTLSWVVQYVWQGRHRTAQEKIEGTPVLPPPPLHLDALEWEPLLKGEVDYALTPEEELINREEPQVREACIERFYDVAYDVVANRMGLTRRRHYTAENDAEVFQLTLRGYNLTGVANALGCSTDMASQRVNYARRRLAAFVEARGVEAIAGWYEGVAGSGHERPVVTDVRAQQAFVAEYVAEREVRLGAEPARRQREEWKSRARAKWVKLEREAQRERMAVAAD